MPLNAISKQNIIKKNSPVGFISHFNQSYPIDWDKEFGRAAPLVVEIGFGNGEYLIENARQNPDKNFIGIEINFDLIKKAARRMQSSNVANIRLLKIHATIALEYLFPSKSISQIYSLFPFPWPKKRHHHHRLFNKAFLKLANNRLIDGGTFLVVTDDKPYFKWILAQNHATGLKAQKEIIQPKFNTRFERIWKEGGQEDFFQILFKKITHARAPLKKETLIAPTIIKKFNPKKYAPKSITGTKSIIFKKFIYDEKKKKGSQLVLTAEKNLTQGFLIFFDHSLKGWKIELSTKDRIIKTKLVQKSFEKIIEACRR